MNDLDRMRADPDVLSVLQSMMGARTHDVALRLSGVILRKYEIFPSVGILRPLMGRGSNQTIQKAINEYKATVFQQLKTDVPPIPVPGLVADGLVNLWKAALIEARKTFEEERDALVAERDDAINQADNAEKRALQSDQRVSEVTAELASAMGREESARQLATATQAARERAERAEDEAKQTVARIQEEMIALSARCDMIVAQTQEQAKEAIEKIEIQYKDLQNHLLAETSRERDIYRKNHDDALAKFSADQERAKLTIRGHEKQIAEYREIIAGLKNESAKKAEDLCSRQIEIDHLKDDLARVNNQVERLMVLLEKVSHAEKEAPDIRKSSPDEVDSMPERNAMDEIMRQVHQELSGGDGSVSLLDWRAEAVERFRDTYGVDTEPLKLFELLINSPSMKTLCRK